MSEAAAERRAHRWQPTPAARRAGGDRPVTILALSAGAPHSPLMAGAVHALLRHMEQDRKRPFDYYYTSGGGALIGLLALAPASGDRYQALQDIVEFGVSDPIYRLVPLGYKTFFKPGPFAPWFQAAADQVKRRAREPFVSLVAAWLELIGGTPRGGTWRAAARPRDHARRIFDDWVDLAFTALAPAPVGPRSTGLCAPAPFIERLVDFEEVRRHDNFVVNAFNLSAGRPEQFWSPTLTADHLRAAIAFPFIYPPVEIDGQLYAEGADHDPINLGELPRAVRSAGCSRGMIVLVDILGGLARYLVRPPRDLWDAYAMSIITPVVELARKNVEIFVTSPAAQQFPVLGYADPSHTGFSFDIPEHVQPHLLDWSYSNMCELWDVGHRAGTEFYDKFGAQLP